MSELNVVFKYLHFVSSIIFLDIANALSNYYIMIICRMLQYEESYCYLHQIETDVHKSSDVISTKTFQAMNGRFSPSQYDNVIFILINDGIDPSFLLMSLWNVIFPSLCRWCFSWGSSQYGIKCNYLRKY